MEMKARIGLLIEAEGARRAAAELDAVAASTDRMGGAARRAGAESAVAAREQKRWQSQLAGLGAVIQRGLLYVSGFGAAIAGVGGYVGLKFDAQMETATTAFSKFLGGPQKARAYLNDLYKLAATTPFEFPQLTAAAQKFLAFGYSARGARDMLRSVADASAGLGKTGGDIDQLVLALGQIKAKGRLQGDEMMQLTEFGLSSKDIGKRLGFKTGLDFSKAMAKGAISSGSALNAIQGYMDAKFHGMAARQGKTFTGQLSTLKDNVSQTLGGLMQPVFNWLRDKALPALTSALPGIAKAIQGFVSGAAPKVVSVVKAIAGAFTGFLGIIKPAAPFLQNILWPALKGLATGVIGALVGAFKVVIPVARVFFSVLGFIGRLARPLRGVFQAIGTVLGFVFAGAILKAIGLIGKLGGVFEWVGGAFGKLGGAMGSVAGRIASAFGLMAGWIKDRFMDVVHFVGSLPGKIAHAAGTLWDGLKQGLAAVVGWIRDRINDVIGLVRSALSAYNSIPLAPNVGLPGYLSTGPAVVHFGHVVPRTQHSGLVGGPSGTHLPGMAEGGVVKRAGLAVVGEYGPELLDLSPPARVAPLPKHSEADGGMRLHPDDMRTLARLTAERLSEVPPEVHLDGEKIAQNTRRHALRDALRNA